MYFEVGALKAIKEELTFETLFRTGNTPITELKPSSIIPSFEVGYLFGKRLKGRIGLSFLLTDLQQIDETPDNFVVPLPNGTIGFKFGLGFGI